MPRRRRPGAPSRPDEPVACAHDAAVTHVPGKVPLWGAFGWQMSAGKYVRGEEKLCHLDSNLPAT